jgi:hypothetical protein
VAKLGRIGLLSTFALSVAMGAGEGRANPWLEQTNVIAQPWDLPFVAQPRPAKQSPAQQKQKRSRNPEVEAERQRELHRMPEPAAAPYEYAPAAANVFPPPRVPNVPMPMPLIEPDPAETVTVQQRTRETAGARDRSRQAAPAARDRNQQAAPVPDRNRQAVPIPAPAPERKQQAAPAAAPTPVRNQQTAAVREADRNAERNLERQLKRELPRLQAPTTGVPPVPEQIACGERLARIARYTPLPARSGPNGCGAPDLVKLETVLMADNSVVAISPSPQIRCSMAEQLAEWVRDEVGPSAVAELGAPLSTITGNDAYECRPRNNIKGARMSEHGRGNAFDLATFRLKNGGVFNFTDPLVDKRFRDRVRTAACGRFMTVLGPGSDGYHSGHIHLDLAERQRQAKVCQWDVREVAVAARSDGSTAKDQPRSGLSLAAAPKAGLDPAPMPPVVPAPAATPAETPAAKPPETPPETPPEKSAAEKTAAVAPAETHAATPEVVSPEPSSPEPSSPETPAAATPEQRVAAAPAVPAVAEAEPPPAATPKEEAIVAAPVAPATNQAEERSTAEAVSPPLPLRKPEALRARQALAQAQQSRPRTERRSSYRDYNYRNLNIFRHLVR